MKCCPRLLSGFSSVGFIFVLEFLGLLSQIETASSVRAVLRAFGGLRFSVLSVLSPAFVSLSQLEQVPKTKQKSAPDREAGCPCARAPGRVLVPSAQP